MTKNKLSKNKLIFLGMKVQSFYEQYKKFLYAGIIFWLGVGAIIYGINLALHPSDTFSANAQEPGQALTTIKSDIKNNQDFTVVVYKPGCSDCKKVEKDFMKQYRQTISKTGMDHVMVDVAKMNTKQKQELLKLLPQIAVQGHKIATPTAAYYHVENQLPDCVEMSIEGSVKQLNSVMKRSELGVEEDG